MPPHLAAKFTTGELAALRVIGDECRDHGCCALHLDAIAGTCKTVVQNALRMARALGLVTVQERRRRGPDIAAWVCSDIKEVAARKAATRKTYMRRFTRFAEWAGCALGVDLAAFLAHVAGKKRSGSSGQTTMSTPHGSGIWSARSHARSR